MFFNENVYVQKPLIVASNNFPNHVYKLKCGLYDLRKALRAWCKRLRKLLLENDFIMGKIDTILCTKKEKKNDDMHIV